MNDQLIEATIESSRRSRFLIILLTFASLLAFISYWNARKESWINKLYQLNEDAMYYASKVTTEKDNAKAIDKKNILAKFKEYYPNLKENEIEKKINLIEKYLVFFNKLELIKLSTTPEDKKLIQEFLVQRRKLYDDLKKESMYLVRVSLFPASFHVNDLLLFSGFTFLVLLILLGLSSRREFENLEFIFPVEPKNSDMKIFESNFYILSARQVFTIPPKVEKDEQNLNLLWIVPKLLFLLPFLVYTIILFEDYSDYFSSSPLELYNLIPGFIFIILLLILTGWCLVVHLNIDRIWNRAGKKIYKFNK